MQPGDHPDCELGHLVLGEGGVGCRVSDTEAVDPEQVPSSAGACRPQVRPAVFLRSADYGWGDAGSSIGPGFCARPAVSGHEVNKCRPYGFVEVLFDWPGEKFGVFWCERDEHEAGAELRNAVVGGLEYPAFWLVAEPGKSGADLAAVVAEFRRRKSGYVLKEDSSGFGVLDQVESGWKHVAVVVGPELFAGDAERRAWDTSGEQIYAREVLVAKIANVRLDDIPMGPVLPQRCAELRLVFDCGRVVEAGHLESEGLTATACAKFQNSEAHVETVDLIPGPSASVQGHGRCGLQA